MANRWGIPKWMEEEIRARDVQCVYCRRPFSTTQDSVKSSSSWEHIINDASIISLDNIALCCRGCNASKGQKELKVWLSSNYCKENGISPGTVSPIIRKALCVD